MFTKRNDVLSRELRDLRASEADLLRKRESKEDGQNAEEEIIPAAQKLLDSYQQLTIPEKNRLWKLILEKATIYRTPEGEISLHIYPKLPKKV
ncbi:MAG: hypothetical protein LUF35_12300 [Lachnospiraceae bacterium]|nr:hypothetical protein [Lachnospiraceae bacterium]